MQDLAHHYQIQEDGPPLLEHLSNDGILRLTMNRPAVHNAFDDAQIERLTLALEAAATNDSVRVVILGSTGKTFCAGGDLNYMRRMGQHSYAENLADASRLAHLLRTLNFLPQPTIARVQGAAFGGGVGLISCCDMAVGSSFAKFSLSEVRLGIAPATIGPYVVRTVGEKVARRLFTTGEVIRAERAMELNLLSEMAEIEQLDQAIESFTENILKNGPTAVKMAKQLVFNVAAGDVTDAMIEKTVNMIADMRDSDEGREGMSAFLEKRPANWIKP